MIAPKIRTKHPDVLAVEEEEASKFTSERPCRAVFIAAFPETTFFYCTSEKHMITSKRGKTRRSCAYPLGNSASLSSILFEACVLDKKEALEQFRLNYLLLDIFGSRHKAQTCRQESDRMGFAKRVVRILRKLPRREGVTVALIPAFPAWVSRSPKKPERMACKEVWNLIREIMAEDPRLGRQFKILPLQSPWQYGWAEQVRTTLEKT